MLVKIVNKPISVGKQADVEYFKGYRHLNFTIVNNYDYFSEELDKSPIFALTNCLEIARREFLDVSSIEHIVGCCFNSIDIDFAEIIERCFFEDIEDPLLSHFISCLSSYGSIMNSGQCVEWLINKINLLGGSNAAHLILSMEVGKC